MTTFNNPVLDSIALGSTAIKRMVLPVGLTLLLLQGCSSKVAAPTFTADPAAFDYAVAETAEMQLYMQECSKLGVDFEQKAKEASTSWNQRNWPQAQAADAAYSAKLASQTISYNNEKIALAAIKLTAGLEKNIRLRLDQTRHSRSSIADICTRKIASYQDGTMDLSRNKNADLYLKSLATTSASSPFKIPSLAGTLATNSNPGRSQYNLEETLKTINCSNAEILTLRNEWPYEVYGAYCTNDKTVFVSCEWGECKSQ